MHSPLNTLNSWREFWLFFFFFAILFFTSPLLLYCIFKPLTEPCYIENERNLNLLCFYYTENSEVLLWKTVLFWPVIKIKLSYAFFNPFFHLVPHKPHQFSVLHSSIGKVCFLSFGSADLLLRHLPPPSFVLPRVFKVQQSGQYIGWIMFLLWAVCTWDLPRAPWW